MSGPLAAPWIAAQTQALLQQRGHAWLLQGPSGLGQYELALALARAWLCHAPTPQGACGSCVSCHAIAVRTHADLCVLMPETTMLALNWPLFEKAQAEIDDKKRKASKEIRIDAMRDAVEFAQRTSAQGRGKVMLVYPAERMNHITANALLKTLEEPPGDMKFVLASEAAHLLLPTIRSRCQTHTMAWPQAESALQWLTQQGLSAEQAQAFLRAAGGRPADAWALAQTGRPLQSWAQFPKAMQRGDVTAVADWSPVELLDALQKLCHDLLALQVGALPRFFAMADLFDGSDVRTLSGWHKTLVQSAKTVEHPFNPGLMLEALVAQAKMALTVPKVRSN